MDGRAVAPAAGTVLNALATGRGAAFAIDLETTATVSLTEGPGVEAEIADRPAADTALLEAAVERTLAVADATDRGAHVRTESEIPMAAGLKSSSAAANAAVLATLDALGESREALEACRLGVEAAREAGVTVTGAFDDASASMLGGVTVTDNEANELLAHEPIDWHALVYTPDERAYSAEADVSACKQVAPIARVVEELAREGRYGEAMSINGLAFSAALDFPTDPILELLPAVTGVSLSGTGPSYVAVGDRGDLEAVRERWDTRPGTTRLLATRTEGAYTS